MDHCRPPPYNYSVMVGLGDRANRTLARGQGRGAKSHRDDKIVADGAGGLWGTSACIFDRPLISGNWRLAIHQNRQAGSDGGRLMSIIDLFADQIPPCHRAWEAQKLPWARTQDERPGRRVGWDDASVVGAAWRTACGSGRRLNGHPVQRGGL